MSNVWKRNPSLKVCEDAEKDVGSPLFAYQVFINRFEFSSS